MNATLIGISVIALAIYIDKVTLFQHKSMPGIAFAGLLAVIASLML